MYNSGKGKMVAVAELVKIRNKERNALLSALKRKKGKGKSGPNILDEFQQEGEHQGDFKKGIPFLRHHCSNQNFSKMTAINLKFLKCIINQRL